MESPTHALATFAPGKAPTLWNVYPDDVAACVAQFNATAPRYEGAEVMTLEEYDARHRSYWMDDEATETDAETFNRMLEVLPPKCWHVSGGVERFLMGERTAGNVTQQYARKGSRYLTKAVDGSDRSTWITAKDFTE